MTPQEKAFELWHKYACCEEIIITGINGNYTGLTTNHAKICALIAVGEIIEEVRDFCDTNYHQDRMLYWQQVKTEIEKP